jgi:hypothetical protein
MREAPIAGGGERFALFGRTDSMELKGDAG